MLDVYNKYIFTVFMLYILWWDNWVVLCLIERAVHCQWIAILLKSSESICSLSQMLLFYKDDLADRPRNDYTVFSNHQVL